MTLGRFGVAFCSANGVGLHDVRPNGAQSHGPPARCLRFAAVVAHVDARLASGWWSAFTGRFELLRQAPQKGFFDVVLLRHRVLPPQALPGALAVAVKVHDQVHVHH
jgi:hypothetical protein